MLHTRTVSQGCALHWDSVIEALHVAILGTPLAFHGRVAEPASSVDFRIFLPRLLEGYEHRGGTVVFGAR